MMPQSSAGLTPEERRARLLSEQRAYHARKMGNREWHPSPAALEEGRRAAAAAALPHSGAPAAARGGSTIALAPQLPYPAAAEAAAMAAVAMAAAAMAAGGSEAVAVVSVAEVSSHRPVRAVALGAAVAAMAPR